MTDTANPDDLWSDPSIARDELEIFGDRVRPTRPELNEEGDYILGFVTSVERNVDLKTGFDPCDIITFTGIKGALAGRTKRVQTAALYAWAVVHATARSQLAAIDPEPSPGERIGIRRGRDFVSTQGPSEGKTLAAWDIIMPDRPNLDNSDKKGQK